MTEKQFFAYMAEDLEDKKNGWKRIVNQPEKKGCAILIHKKVIEGEKLNMIRSDSRLKGVNIEQYKNFMNDTEKIKNDKSIMDFKIIEEDIPNMKKIYYMEMKMPLMKNRTALLDMTINDKLDDGKQVLMLS